MAGASHEPLLPGPACAKEGNVAPLSEHQRGLLVMTVGVLAMVPDGSLIKVVQASGETVACWRLGLTGVVLLVLQLARHGRTFPTVVYSMGRWGVAVTILAGFSNMMFVEAVKRTSVANALLLMSTSQFWAALFSRACLGTPIRACTWVAMPVVLTGVAISLSDGLRIILVDNSGNAIALLIAVLGGLRRTILRSQVKIDMQPAIPLGSLLYCVLLLLYGVPVDMVPQDWLPIALLGLVVMPVSLALTTKGSQLLPSAESCMLMCIETVCSPVMAAFVVGDKVSAQTWAGLGVVVAALAGHAAWQLLQPVESSAKSSPPKTIVIDE